MTWQNHSPGSNYCFTRTYWYTDRQFWIPMKHAKHSTGIKPTLGSVNGDVFGSWFASSLTSLKPWITSLCSPLRKSMPFCKSTRVMTVALTHYMKLNTIRTISCSVKTDNSCFVQIYCIAMYKTTAKKTPKQRNLLLQNITANGCTMFRVPIMSQTNPVYTFTRFNGKYKIEIMTAHPTDGRKNINSSGK